MRKNTYRILTVLLAVVLLVTLAVSVQAVNKTTATKDGLYVIFTTDEKEYTGTEQAKVNVQIVNTSFKSADVQVQLNLDKGIEVIAGAVSQVASIEPGVTWDADEVTLAFHLDQMGGQDEQGDNDGSVIPVIVGIVAGVILVAGAVVLILYCKKKHNVIATMLCISLLLSFVAMAMPVQATSEQDSFTASTEITVDGVVVNLSATISYTLEEDKGGEEEEEDDGRLVAFYYNDFEDPDRWIQDGATIEYGSDQIVDSAEESSGNHYGYIEIKNKTSSAYMSADLKNSRPVEHMVIRMDLSTGNFVPQGSYVQYRYCSTTNHMLIQIKNDGILQIGNTVYDNIRIEKGKWLQIEFVIDFTNAEKDVAAVYINNEKLTDIDLPKVEADFPIPFVRFSVNGKDDAGAYIGGNMWMDNIAIYESAERLPLDQIKSPKIAVGERRATAADVEMDHPELADLGEGAIAVLAGSSNAFAGGKLITLSAEAEAVYTDGKTTDVKVPGAFLEQYLNASNLEDTKLYSIKEYANGRQITIDSRGLIIISPKQLDTTADIKLLTMVYGYLKTGILASNYAVAPMFSQNVIDEAFGVLDVGHGPYSNWSTEVMYNMNAIYYLTMVARMDPERTSSDGKSVTDEAVKRIKHMISGGREPNCQPGCFWTQALAGNILVLARKTPSIWNSLTAEEQGKMDLLMECLAIASNWGQNAQNNYRTGFDLLGNFGKNYNPNYLNASLTNYLNAVMYFGADEVDEIFTSFDYDTYMARLEKAGFTNVSRMWSTTDCWGISIGEYMMYGGEVLLNGQGSSGTKAGTSAGTGAGVKIPWQYEDLKNRNIYDKNDFHKTFIAVLEYTYSLAVISNNGIPNSMTYAYIISGAKSPYTGQMGMMTEFSASDSGSYTRSKCMYSFLSAQIVSGVYANMKLLGYWDYDAQTAEMAARMREMDSRIQVGNEDLFFKLQEGYMGNSQQVSVEEYAEDFVWNGLNCVEDIWYNFHAMNNQIVNITATPQQQNLQEAAKPMNGELGGEVDAPKGAWKPIDQVSAGFIAADGYEIDGNCYSVGTLEFDLTLGDDLRENSNMLIRAGRGTEGHPTVCAYPMMVSLQNGSIFVYDEDEYKATKLKYGPNYRYHITMDFNCETKRYDVSITQTWPKSDKTVTDTIKDCWFNPNYGDAPYVNYMLLTARDGVDEYWVENVKISGTKTTERSYDPYRELTVKMDWSEVPVSKRPSSVKVHLVYNGIILPHKYVILSAENGWKVSFKQVPTMINHRVAQYSVYMEALNGYKPVISEIDEKNVITIYQTTKPIIYENDFETGELGILTDNMAWQDKGASEIVTHDGNKYLVLNDDNKLEHQMGLIVDGMFMENGELNDLYGMIFFEMDIKKAETNSEMGGYALGYRKARPDGTEGTVSHNLINIDNNKVQVLGASKSYTIGELTDEWQTLKVYLDVKNCRVMVTYGSENNYIILEDMPPVANNQFLIATWRGRPGLAIDNMKVYCDASKTLESIINAIKFDLSVEMKWESDVAASLIPDEVKVFLMVNGEMTDQYVTLIKAENWSAKAFTGLPAIKDGQKQVYSAQVAAIPGVFTRMEEKGDRIIFNSYGKYIYYENDFTDFRTTTVSKQSAVQDNNGNLLIFSAGTPTVAEGENPYLSITGATVSLDDAGLATARNVIINMKLKAEQLADNGQISLRYHGGEDTRKEIFGVSVNNGVATYKFFGKNLGTLTASQWLDIQIMFDLNDRICRIKIDDGVWEYAYDCPENNGSYIRMWANAAMTWGIDDVMIYSDGSWVAEETAPTVDVHAAINWADGEPAKDSVKVQLYCDGVAVPGKVLTLSAANGWSGVFADLSARNEAGKKASYTIKHTEDLSGYNVYYTGNGAVMNLTRNTYYYWNDFEHKSMTDVNGVAPITCTGPITYITADQVHIGYRGTFVVGNSEIASAENLFIGFKLRLDQLAASSLFSLRYVTQSNDKYPILEVSVNSSGTAVTVRLGGEKVDNLSLNAEQWYDVLVAYNQVTDKVVLYIDGQAVGMPIACQELTGSDVKLYANAMDWIVDDLRIYTAKGWDLYADYKTTVDTSITWNDDNNAEGKRPASVVVTLVADGNAVSNTVVLNASNQWKATFTDLPQYNSTTGKEIVYTVQTAVEDHICEYAGTDITLTYFDADATLDNVVTILWNDHNDRDGYRPGQVTVQLYVDGIAAEGKTLVITAADGWTGTFAGLLEFNSETRLPYQYSVRIVKVPHYSATYDDTAITMTVGPNMEGGVDSGEGMEPFPD